MFVLIGAEFLAMLLVVVYVGAVAVLFLFVVMMLDINLLKCALAQKCCLLALLLAVFWYLSSLLVMYGDAFSNARLPIP